MSDTATAVQPVKLFVRGATGLRDCLLSRADAGATLDEGVREMVAGSSDAAPPVEVAFEECAGIASFVGALQAGADGGQTMVYAESPNIVVLSLEADLRASKGAWGSAEADAFESNLRKVVRLVKENLGSHVIIVNASSLDPATVVSTYEGLDQEPLLLRAHRYNLATMRVSSDEGVSIVDADRLVAEMGGTGQVTGFLTYAPGAAEAVCRELVRVVGDYGFLDTRPILPQVGRETKS